MTALEVVGALEQFTACLASDLDRLREAQRQTDRIHATAFNVFNYLAPDENVLSDLLADLLDPNGSHGQGDQFLERFLQAAKISVNHPLTQVHIRREDVTTFIAQARRIDFTIEIASGRFAVGVENKPWTWEQDDQVADYVRHLSRKYGDAQFAMVYLSGSGADPRSLPPEKRTYLESANRFRTLPYSGAIREWLISCRSPVCRATKVDHFLADFVAYIDQKFPPVDGVGRATVTKYDVETNAIVQHAVRTPANLAIVMRIIGASSALADSITSNFSAALVARLSQELGEDWRVRDASQDDKLAENWEQIAVSKVGWSDSTRVVLCRDNRELRNLYFQVRRKHGEPQDAIGDHIAKVLDEQCGGGVRRSDWWPRWWRSADRYSDWTDLNVLLALHGKDESLDYFSKRLVGIARAVDIALCSRGTE